MAYFLAVIWWIAWTAWAAVGLVIDDPSMPAVAAFALGAVAYLKAFL